MWSVLSTILIALLGAISRLWGDKAIRDAAAQANERVGEVKAREQAARERLAQEGR